MKKKNLIIVNTYFQLMTIINMCLNNLKEDVNDLIVTDKSADMEEKINKLKEYNIFKNIYYVKSKDICIDKNKVKKYLTYLFDRKKILTVELKEVYDYLYFFNYDLLTYCTLDEIAKKNKNVKCKKYDEGFISYLYDVKNNNINNIVRKLLLRKNIDKSIEAYYLYHPDLICYDSKYPIEKIKVLDKSDEKLKSIYNNIFNYTKDKIKQKYIFFEESFFCDGGKDVNDLELILKIAETVGKENLLVKLHPRNKINRFAEYGIATNKTIGIPWELIQMNDDFSDKVLLTISSGSVLASKLYFNDNIKTYLLFNCTDKMSNMVTEKYFEYLKKLENKFGLDNFIIPKNEEEFLKKLNESKMND